MLAKCLSTVLFQSTVSLCVPKDSEQCFVNANYMTGWSIHLSSNLVEVAFELATVNTDYCNKSAVRLVRFITSHLNNEERKNEGSAPSANRGSTRGVLIFVEER